VNDWLVVSHAVAISGRVINTRTNAAVAGAQVKITNGPADFMNMLDLQAKSYGRRWKHLRERPDRKSSTYDGHFHFLDLPEGAYTLSAMLSGAGSRYGTAQISVAVSLDSLGDLLMTTVELNLPPTTIRGQITDQTSGDPIVMARVSIQGSNESLYTDNQGDYMLSGLETGTRILQVSAQGFQSVSQTVNLAAAGTEVTQHIALASSGT